MRPGLRFSEAANLAVHACALIRSQGSGGRMTHRTVAEALSVSESHLGKVMQKLVRCGILTSERGAAGGFSLAVPPERLTLLDIIRCIDGEEVRPACLLGSPVCRRGECILSDLADRVASLVEVRLGSATIEEFANKQLSKRNRRM